MKKRFSFLISCVVAASTLTGWAAVPAYDAQSALTSARADIANWMKYLPDEVFVAHVSIPGSHDTATGHNVTIATSSQAQEKTLPEQLAGGIRAFDFRPGFAKNKDITCNHGIATTDLTMKEAFKILTDYLREHPTEFFAIHLFRGAPSSDPAIDLQAVYNKQIDELFNTGEFADFFIDYNPYLTVKEIRGKIVVFRRDRLAWVNITKAGNLSGWPGDSDLWTAGQAATAINASDLGVSGKIRVTDVSSPKGNADKIETEKQSIINLFNYNCNETRPNAAKQAEGRYKPEWTMMFTSGEGTTSGKKGYLGNCEITHPLLIDLINNAEVSGPTGIVFSDWVLLDKYEYLGTEYNIQGDVLVTTIIENNFKYISEYILDDELFGENKNNNIPEANPIGGKEYYFRNVETGQFLSCGADWGTRSVIGDQGIRILPSYIGENGTYMLKTTFAQHGIGVPNFFGPDLYIDNGSYLEVKFVPAGATNTYYITYPGENNTVLALAPERNVTGNTYADGSKYLIVGLEYAENDPRMQWEIITEEDLVNELSSHATAENGVDLSFMIRGNKLRVNDQEENAAWNFINEPVDGLSTSSSYRMKQEVATPTNEWYDKKHIYRIYNTNFNAKYSYKWSAGQTVEGLPNGFYEISLQALAANMPLDNEEEFSFTVNGKDLRSKLTTDENGSISASDALAKFRDESLNHCLATIDDVEVTDGKLNIRMAGNISENVKRSFYFDNVGLKYFGKTSTGVESVGMGNEGINGDTPVSVYSLSGVQLRNDVPFSSALEGLDRGIYLVRSASACMKMAK